MAQFTIEVADDVLESVSQYIGTQHRVEHDPETNLPKVTRLFSSPEDFIQKSLAQILAGVTQQFPTPAMRQHLLAKRQAELAMEAAIRPQFIKVGGQVSSQ